MDSWNLMYLNGSCTGFLDNKDLVTPFSRMATRSASENSSLNAWNVNFSDGNTNNNNKYNTNRVRAVVALDAKIKEGWVQAKNDCCVNKMSSQQCEEWRMYAEQELWSLMYEVYFGDYKPTTSTCFVVSFPTYREIFAAAFRDRVVQHWICARLNPLFELRFHEQKNVSFNCRKGYGTIKAVEALKSDMNYRTLGFTRKGVWIGRFDIKAFFMNIDKNILWALLEPFIRENYHEDDLETLIKLTKIVIFHCPQDDCKRQGNLTYWEKGYLPAHKSLFNVPRHLAMAIGNILSQLCANFYMSFFDAVMLKLCRRLSCSYKRFVDDWTVVGSKEAILYIRKVAERWLRLYLHLTLHPDKVYLQPVHHGVKFVGAYVLPYRTYLSNRTFGGFRDQMFCLNNLCTKIKREGVNYTILKRLEHEVSSLNSYAWFSVHHRTMKRRMVLYAPFAENIRSVCNLNYDYCSVKIPKRYNHKLYLYSLEDYNYDLSSWNCTTRRRHFPKKPRKKTVHDKLRHSEAGGRNIQMVIGDDGAGAMELR